MEKLNHLDHSRLIPAHFDMTKWLRYFYAHWYVILTGHSPFERKKKIVISNRAALMI